MFGKSFKFLFTFVAANLISHFGLTLN